MRHSSKSLLLPLLALLSLGFAALACNLSSDSNPPTLVPRATATLLATLGIATLAPEQLPDSATVVPQARTDAVLLNLLNEVQVDSLVSHVSAMDSMFTRHVNSVQNDPTRGVGAAAAYVTEQFNRIRDNSGGRFSVVRPHEFTTVWAEVETNQRNIVGILGGTEAGAGIILVGAHYDSISIDDQSGETYAPGANDNASGVAAMIEIARIMSTRNHRATIMFVAFAAEEIGRQGSIAFIRDYLAPNNIRIDAMINLDIIGSSMASNGAYDDTTIRLFSAEPNEPASTSRHLARMINLIAERHVPYMSVQVQGTGDREGRYSDHLSFSDAGYPAVRFIEMMEDRNRQHTDADRVGWVRGSYLTAATQTILASVTALADGPRPPGNIQLRDDGSPIRTLVWETTPDAATYVIALRSPGQLIFNEYFVVSNNSVQWEGFRAPNYVGVSIAAQDANGLMGPLSFEYAIGS